MSLPQPSPSDSVNVHHFDLAGCVRFFTDVEATSLPNLPGFLAYGVTAWFRASPQCCLTCGIPVNKDGNTVEMYA